jgi:TolA-binding protein
LGDDALFSLASLEESYLKDNEKAKQHYQELLTKYPGSLYTVEARKRFRKLRGDNLN